MEVLYSNMGSSATPPGRVTTYNDILLKELRGGTRRATVRSLGFSLKPMEIQILGKRL